MSAIRLLPAAGTRATLAIDGPASATWNTVMEAVAEGPLGNQAALAAVADGTWVACAGTFTASANPTNAAATGTLTLTGQPSDTQTCTIDVKVYTFQTVLTNVDGNVLIGATASDTIDNLIAAITLGAGGGSTYAAATTLHPTVTAAAGAGDTMTATAKTRGTGGNSIATTETMSNASWGGATLSGGTTETVTIDTTVYTFKASGNVTTAFDVLIGASASDTLDNFIAAVNDTGTEGTHYGTGTTEHTTVRAYAGAGDTMVVHSRPEVLAAAGTLIATTETCAACAWGATTLGDGTDGTNVTFGVSGTTVTVHYANGFSTVEDFEAAVAASTSVLAVMNVKTAGTTQLYLLIVGDDDFSATNFTAGGAASSAAPTITSATAGVPAPHLCDEALFLLANVDTATGTTKTATGTLWGFSPVTALWAPIGAINGGGTIAEVASDRLSYCEIIRGLRRFSRFYFQIGALGGAGTEVAVYLDCTPADTSTR